MDPGDQRTHDKAIYLKENRYDRPKEIFKVLGDLTERDGPVKKGAVMADFGCAAGEFLYFLGQRFPETERLGFDLVPELIAKAETMVPGAKFTVGSVLDRFLTAEASIDYAYLQGVLSIFDEFETTLDNLIAWTRPGGRIYVFGVFNPFPVDVWVRYRLADDPHRDHREPGWNMFSKKSISDFLNKRLGAGRHYYQPFAMPFDLEKQDDDPVRSWTMKDEAGARLFTNGLSLLLNLEVLVIRP